MSFTELSIALETNDAELKITSNTERLVELLLVRTEILKSMVYALQKERE